MYGDCCSYLHRPSTISCHLSKLKEEIRALQQQVFGLTATVQNVVMVVKKLSVQEVKALVSTTMKSGSYHKVLQKVKESQQVNIIQQLDGAADEDFAFQSNFAWSLSE